MLIGLLKVSYTACPGNICFFLTTDPQLGGYFNITPHSNLANVISLGVEYLANNADLLTSLPHRHAQWNQKPRKINEGLKNRSFHFFKK